MHLPLPAVPPPLCLLSGRLATIHVSIRRLASSAFSPIRQERPLLFTNGEGNTLQMKKKNKKPCSVFAFSTKKQNLFRNPLFCCFFYWIYSLKLSNAAREEIWCKSCSRWTGSHRIKLSVRFIDHAAIIKTLFPHNKITWYHHMDGLNFLRPHCSRLRQQTASLPPHHTHTTHTGCWVHQLSLLTRPRSQHSITALQAITLVYLFRDQSVKFFDNCGVEVHFQVIYL